MRMLVPPAFGYVFLLILFAAGIELAVVRFDEPSTTDRAILAGGVGSYALGLALFRWLLRGAPLMVRLALGMVALPTALVGVALSAIWQLVVLGAILGIAVVAAGIAARRSA